jgi:hypothetical protein
MSLTWANTKKKVIFLVLNILLDGTVSWSYLQAPTEFHTIWVWYFIQNIVHIANLLLWVVMLE